MYVYVCIHYLLFILICNYYSPIILRKISTSHAPTVIQIISQSLLVQQYITFPSFYIENNK